MSMLLLLRRNWSQTPVCRRPVAVIIELGGGCPFRRTGVGPAYPMRHDGSCTRPLTRPGALSLSQSCTENLVPDFGALYSDIAHVVETRCVGFRLIMMIGLESVGAAGGNFARRGNVAPDCRRNTVRYDMSALAKHFVPDVILKLESLCDSLIRKASSAKLIKIFYFPTSG